MTAVELGVKYLQDHARRLYDYIEKMSIDIGDKCDNYMEAITARRRYWCDVLLRVPLIFIIHQWLLLSPYSSYWTINVILFLARHGVAFTMVFIWTFNSGVLLQAYITLTFDLAINWIKQIDYWTNQDSGYEFCHEKNVPVWSDLEDNIGLPMICSTLLQLIYLCSRPAVLSHRINRNCSTMVYTGLQLTMFPKILILLGIFPVFLSELAYWIDSILLIIIILLEIMTLTMEDLNVDEKKMVLLDLKIKDAKNDDMKIKYISSMENLRRRIASRRNGENFLDLLPSKWFTRDIILVFGIIYAFFVVFIEITVNQISLISIVSARSTLLEICTKWCTTTIIVLFISHGFGLISNITVALSQLFLTSQIHILETLDADIGRPVHISTVITFIECDFLALENIEKIDALKLTAFFSLYVIIFQTLYILEQRLLLVVNSGSFPGLLFYLRAIILYGFLITISSLLTLFLSKSLDISRWQLFLASGNLILIFRSISLLLECSLIKATWCTTSNLARLADAIQCTKICKILATILFTCIENYYRYMCPLFKGWWLFRLCLALFNVTVVVVFLGIQEFSRYTTRNGIFDLLTKFPDMPFHTNTMKTDAEVTHKCTICYTDMTEAKKLPCNHVFHRDCLKKWFQVRMVCPLCNTEINNENIYDQRQQWFEQII